MVAASSCVQPHFQWCHLAYAREIKSISCMTLSRLPCHEIVFLHCIHADLWVCIRTFMQTRIDHWFESLIQKSFWWWRWKREHVWCHRIFSAPKIVTSWKIQKFWKHGMTPKENTSTLWFYENKKMSSCEHMVCGKENIIIRKKARGWKWGDGFYGWFKEIGKDSESLREKRGRREREGARKVNDIHNIKTNSRFNEVQRLNICSSFQNNELNSTEWTWYIIGALIPTNQTEPSACNFEASNHLIHQQCEPNL